MTSRPRSRILPVAAALGAATLMVASCSGQQDTEKVTDAVFFGDSLSDAGTAGVRYTTSPGRIWAQILAEELGQPDTPATSGGANYAEGGARVSEHVTSGPHGGAGPRPVTEQIDQYLANHPAPGPDQLFTIFIGTNDVLSAGAQADTQIFAAVNGELDAVDRLLDAGAQQVLVFSLFDLALTPAFGGTDTAAHLSIHDRTLDYNRQLLEGLGTRHPNDPRVGIFDTFGLLNDFVTEGANYGFTHGAGQDACATPGASSCDSTSLVAPDADRTYVFAGGVHLTTATNRLLAEAVERRISELWS